MELDDIFKLWQKDSQIDITDLHNESINIPKLHSKYYNIYSAERLIQRRLESDMKKLKLAKYEFYSMGPDEETPKHWKLPARGKILRTEIPNYMDGDEDIINLSLKIGYQQEKVEFLDSVIRSLRDRGFNIKNSIEYMKFTSGG